MRVDKEFIHQLVIILEQAPPNLPRYRALYEALRQQILEGFLLPGTCLPSSRVIAQELGYARNTVMKALEQLCAEGYALARPKSGTYILATAPSFGDCLQLTAPSNIVQLSSRGKRISDRALPISEKRGAFAVGVPDLKQFPFVLWQRYLTRHARNPKLSWQINASRGGSIELRQALVDYLRMSRGIICDKTQILITHGTQHSLNLIANLLADLGDKVWVEDPGYLGARCIFDAAGLTVIPKMIDDEGLSPEQNAWDEPPQLIYLTPSHQFPTGVVMSATRRRHLLALALQHQSVVIEDDYDSEFRYTGASLAALHALAPKQVIYLGTFSKTFFPALGIGYMVLPEHLVEAFQLTQARYQREPSYVMQTALADFIRDGHASHHICKMRREYQSRRDNLVLVLKQELAGLLRLDGLDTGMHLIAYLPSDLDDQQVAVEAYQQGIIVSALSQYYETSTKQSALLLGFGDVDQTQVFVSGKRLCRIIENLF
jgi:GntR family transcriptional regulator/MocR family aminotransferase